MMSAFSAPAFFPKAREPGSLGAVGALQDVNSSAAHLGLHPTQANSYLHSPSKRAVDLSLSLALLLLLLPLLILIAVAVKVTSRGPILFRQERTGAGFIPFQIYKFRSMYVDEQAQDVQQATRNDARVTSVGRILRKTSMDELPQLFNVIKGDMSLVGPRPHAVAHDVHYSGKVARYLDRFHARPGVTGLAQVNGARGQTPRTEDMQRRIEWDVRYITGASLLMDVRILFKTVREVAGSPQAF